MTAAAQQASRWRLSELLAGITPLPGGHDPAVSGLCADSREVAPGDLFCARPGTETDGRRFIDAAIRAGAVAVLLAGERELCEWRGAVPLVAVSDFPACMGAVADRLFGCPSRSLRVVGVTGTNGKTSVTQLVAQVLHGIPDAAPCGVIGTLGHGLCGSLAPARLTTPDVVATHRTLRDLVLGGARHALMEVSSHGLAQGRVAGVHFDVAVLTNLTRDHLDYHGDRAAYARAKRRLWRDYPLRATVLNVDDAFGRELLRALPAGVEALTFGLAEAAASAGERPAVRARVLSAGRQGMRLRMQAPGREVELASRLIGRGNAYNLVAAAATLLALGIPLEAAADGLSRVRPLAGRMQVIGGHRPDHPLVVVDYAHTPDALSWALGALRELAAGQLWCVFGCGGGRDRGKRPLMGRIAMRGAERVVVTSDNPRGEDPQRIIADILAGIRERRDLIVEPDRGAAIRRAVLAAKRGDAVLVAGKGHEAYQEAHGARRPFSDAAAVRAALEARDR